MGAPSRMAQGRRRTTNQGRTEAMGFRERSFALRSHHRGTGPKGRRVLPAARHAIRWEGGPSAGRCPGRGAGRDRCQPCPACPVSPPCGPRMARTSWSADRTMGVAGAARGGGAGDPLDVATTRPTLNQAAEASADGVVAVGDDQDGRFPFTAWTTFHPILRQSDRYTRRQGKARC